ncbi:HeH/LEM domain-containing protein [Listeria seeligeri]
MSEIKTILDEKGINYKTSDNKAALISLLEEA